MSELQDVIDWIPFGLYLGIKIPRLEAIKVDHPTLGERRTQMLNEWQKNVHDSHLVCCGPGIGGDRDETSGF